MAYIRGTYSLVEKHFNLQSVKLTFLSLFQHKARILAFFMKTFLIIKTPEHEHISLLVTVFLLLTLIS